MTLKGWMTVQVPATVLLLDESTGETKCIMAGTYLTVSE